MAPSTAPAVAPAIKASAGDSFCVESDFKSREFTVPPSGTARRRTDSFGCFHHLSIRFRVRRKGRRRECIFDFNFLPLLLEG